MTPEEEALEKLKTQALEQVHSEQKRVPRLGDKVHVDIMGTGSFTMKGRILSINGNETINVRVGVTGAVVPLKLNQIKLDDGDNIPHYTIQT